MRFGDENRLLPGHVCGAGHVALCHAGLGLPMPRKARSKIFILAGQSNMEGQGVVSMDDPHYFRKAQEAGTRQIKTCDLREDHRLCPSAGAFAQSRPRTPLVRQCGELLPDRRRAGRRDEELLRSKRWRSIRATTPCSTPSARSCSCTAAAPRRSIVDDIRKDDTPRNCRWTDELQPTRSGRPRAISPMQTPRKRGPQE